MVVVHGWGFSVAASQSEPEGLASFPQNLVLLVHLFCGFLAVVVRNDVAYWSRGSIGLAVLEVLLWQVDVELLRILMQTGQAILERSPKSWLGSRSGCSLLNSHLICLFEVLFVHRMPGHFMRGPVGSYYIKEVSRSIHWKEGEEEEIDLHFPTPSLSLAPGSP
jgi:hypothetical protein